MKNLNWKNVKPMMKQFHDDCNRDDYNKLWEAVWALSAYGFEDMQTLFEKIIKYDHELFNKLFNK